MMIFEKGTEFVEVVFRGRTFSVDRRSFDILKNYRAAAIRDETQRPFCGKTQKRVHPLAERGEELVPGGRVLSQEMTTLSGPMDPSTYLFENTLGLRWFEWETQ